MVRETYTNEHTKFTWRLTEQSMFHVLVKNDLLSIKLHVSFKWQRLNTADEVLMTV